MGRSWFGLSITGPEDQMLKLGKTWKLKIATTLNMGVEGQSWIKKLQSNADTGAQMPIYQAKIKEDHRITKFGANRSEFFL